MFKPLELVDAQELLLTPLNEIPFLVEDIIPGGLNVIAGDEKSGKSWMMLQLAISIATGHDFLDHHTDQGTVLYLSLEDTYARLQKRMFSLTNEIGFGNLIDFIKERRIWRGSATELLGELGDQSVGANVITKYINQYKGSLLLDEGIVYSYSRTHAEGRMLSFKLCDSCDGCDSKEDNSR